MKPPVQFLSVTRYQLNILPAGESQLCLFVFYSCLGFLGCSTYWHWPWPRHLTCPHISSVVLCLFVWEKSSCFGVDSGDGQITWAAVQRRHRLLRHSEGEFEIFSAEYLASSIRLKKSKNNCWRNWLPAKLSSRRIICLHNAIMVQPSAAALLCLRPVVGLQPSAFQTSNQPPLLLNIWLLAFG